MSEVIKSMPVCEGASAWVCELVLARVESGPEVHESDPLGVSSAHRGVNPSHTEVFVVHRAGRKIKFLHH